jgi:hypothetical protein
MTDLPRSPRYNATSLARALTILDLFEPATPSLSATQIARRLRVRVIRDVAKYDKLYQPRLRQALPAPL